MYMDVTTCFQHLELMINVSSTRNVCSRLTAYLNKIDCSLIIANCEMTCGKGSLLSIWNRICMCTPTLKICPTDLLSIPSKVVTTYFVFKLMRYYFTTCKYTEMEWQETNLNYGQSGHPHSKLKPPFS